MNRPATAVLDRPDTARPPAVPAPRTGPDRPAGRWQVGRALVGAGLALLTAVAFAPVFGRTPVEALTDPHYVGKVSGVVPAIAAVCLLLATVTKVAPVTRVAAALAVLAGYVALVVAPGWAVASGPKRLLTSTFPLEPEGAELAAVVIVVGLATMGAVEPALRRRAAALPLLAPLAATALGSAVAAGAGAPAGWLAPALAFGAAVLLALARYAPDPDGAATAVGVGGRSGEGGRAAGWARQAIAGLLGCAMLGGAAAAGWYGSALLTRTGRDAPADARNLVPQPIRPREGTSPLVLYPALRRGEQALSLTVQAKTPPDLLRYVSLDRFDGEYWNTGAQYRRAGRRLPAEEPARPSAGQRAERVHIDDAGPLGWLVSSGRPVEVSVRGLGVNEGSGDVVLPADRPVPADYTVRSAVPVYDEDALAADNPVVSSPAAGGPVLPRRLTSLAGGIAGGESGYPALRRLEEYFRPSGPASRPGVPRRDFRVDLTPQAPGGHGLHQINRLLFGDTPHGTAEQYASAFAVMARALGYDARVVVGFRARASGPGVYTVTGKDVHAWVEVRFAAHGWVRFDPTPARSTTDASLPAPPPSAGPSSGTADQDDRPTPTPNQTAAQPGEIAPAAPGSGGYAALITLVLAGLPATYAGGVLIAKATLRWRRRRLGGPDRRTAAAWRDTLDRLVEAGLEVAPADTSGEVVAAVRRRFGDGVGLPVSRLAVLSDEAAFAPGSRAEPAAAAAWLNAEQARREISSALPTLHRLRAALNVRPMWRSGKVTARRVVGRQHGVLATGR
jgi:hypothetical protein